MVKTENIKSIIVSKDRNFRTATTQMFNNVAYPGEKLVVTTADEAKAILARDPTVKNIVVDATAFEGQGLGQFFERLQSEVAERLLRVLVYVPEDKVKFLVPVLAEKHRTLVFKVPPLKKNDFVEAFHKRIETVSAVKSDAPDAKKAPSAAALNFIEASKHVKDTLSLLQELKKDATKVGNLLGIGQKFNGMIGTYAFVADKDGYKQLLVAARIIDDIARHYNTHSTTKAQVEERHLTLLIRSSECAYRILQELRADSPVSEKNNAETRELEKIYTTMPEIERRSGNSQNDVDAILESLGKPA